jgi:hypothetical protein
VTQSFKDLKAELLRDPMARAEYDSRAEEFEITRELIAARPRAGLSQEQLARRRPPVPLRPGAAKIGPRRIG